MSTFIFFFRSRHYKYRQVLLQQGFSCTQPIYTRKLCRDHTYLALFCTFQPLPSRSDRHPTAGGFIAVGRSESGRSSPRERSGPNGTEPSNKGSGSLKCGRGSIVDLRPLGSRKPPPQDPFLALSTSCSKGRTGDMAAPSRAFSELLEMPSSQARIPICRTVPSLSVSCSINS